MNIAALRSTVAAVILALSGCAAPSTPSVAPAASVGAGYPVECGPIDDTALCRRAVEVATTAKLNPPPIAAASLRRPRLDDACATALHPCGPESVIVEIQSGDTLQEVPLVRTGDGWVLHALIR